MKLIEMVVNHKMNNITPDELLTLAGEYQLSLTQNEAVQISQLFSGTKD